jgi:hypothetical protein
MPNWCSNNFSITGCVESIKDLWDSAQTANDGEFGLLEAIAPQPDFPEEQEDQVMPNWWNWRVDNWGTKWDVSDEGLEFIDHGDGTASITGWFDSAWSPPIGAYEQLAADFDSCVIECSYYEPGMDFAGFWSSENGEEHLDNLHEEYELPEDDRSDLYNRLDEEYNLSENYDMWDEDEELIDEV